jgi:hypothetical protein
LILNYREEQNKIRNGPLLLLRKVAVGGAVWWEVIMAGGWDKLISPSMAGSKNRYAGGETRRLLTTYLNS